MAVTTIANAAPRFIPSGFKDEGYRTLPSQSEDLPQHFPLFYIYAKRGKLIPILASGNYAKNMFGTETFEERSKYFTHQTLAFTTCNAVGNVAFLRRVVPADATRASIVFSIEIVEDDVPQFDRDADGKAIRDVNGDRVLSGNTEPGYRVRIIKTQVTDINNLRGEIRQQGTLVGGTGKTSMIYPLFAGYMEVGEFGNNLGTSWYQPNVNTPDPADGEVIDAEGAMIYRSVWKERESARKTPFIVPTINNEQYVEFCMAEGIVNSKFDMALPFSRVVTDYQQEAIPGFEMQAGPLEDFYVYQDNIDAVSEILGTLEAPFQDSEFTNNKVNLLSGSDHSSREFYSYFFDDSSLRMDADTVHYAEGGSDGTMTHDTFDELVAHECRNNWSDPEYPLLDMALHPFSVLYDTGFTLDTKKAIIDTIGYRNDISVGYCSQNVQDPKNSISEDSAILTSLRTYARLTPESVIHGTPVCRAVAWAQCGTWINSNYKFATTIPVLMALIEKRAAYMGASNGIYKGPKSYDVDGSKQINTMTNVSHPWKPDLTSSKDWAIGMNWVIRHDRNTLFIPASQTIYDDDTSPLNSDINMLIMVDILKKSHIVWRRMVGNVKFTDPQFAERSDELLLELTDGIYDGRCVIRPNTVFTRMDKLRGYSWTQNTEVYLNNMRTVETVNLIVRRMSDLA